MTQKPSFLHRARRAVFRMALVLAALAALTALAIGVLLPEVYDLWIAGDIRQLRHRSEHGQQASTAARPGILIIALDGVQRSVLYDLLRDGSLPHFVELLGGVDSSGAFRHAHLDDSLLATLPSATIPGWTTVFAGVPPAEHGVTGNEFFIRERREFAAPIPTSFRDASPVIATFTEGLVNSLLKAPTVYQRLRQVEQDVRIWVVTNQVYAGADRLLLANRAVLGEAFAARVSVALGARAARAAYEEITEEVVGNLIDALEHDLVPDVLTLYIANTDRFAHVAENGPRAAQRVFLREVLDRELGRLLDKLRELQALDRYVVVVADHGHTALPHDKRYALGVEGPHEPPDVLRAAGFRVRNTGLASERADYQAVLAYQGAMAFVYLADRSLCSRTGQRCQWDRPPRYELDVLRAAEAFWQADASGAPAPGMRGALDLVLVRRPRPYREIDLPFEVYLGNGRTESLEAFLQHEPRSTYVAFSERLRDLAVGRYGERAGDVLLLTNVNDDSTGPRRYFGTTLYRSGHGSPTAQDSQVPLIVAHPHHSAAALRTKVQSALGPMPRLQRVGDLLLELRRGEY